MNLNLIEDLLGGYFHEDWTDDYETWEAAVDQCVRDAPTEVSALLTSLRELLATYDEARLRQMCADISVPVDFAVLSGSYVSWFREVAARLERHLAT